MPDLEFYALDSDWTAVLDLVLARPFRVFESHSRPGTQVREFSSTAEVLDAWEPPGPVLMLWAEGSGPDPHLGRIDLDPEAWDGGTFRYECNGWGMIQLMFGTAQDVDGNAQDALHSCRISHNTQKRAIAWASDTPELGDPAAWNWPVVIRAAKELVREVRGLAVSPGRPLLLPDAARAVERDGLSIF